MAAKSKAPPAILVHEEEAEAPTPNASTGLGSEVTSADLQKMGILGRGAFGVVEKHLHVPSQRVVAVKILPLKTDQKTRQQILVELRTLDSSSCPAIVQFHSAFFLESGLWIVMELMDGGSLKDVLNKYKKLEEPILATVARRVLVGLDYLHRVKKVMHRDLKPANLLLNTQGEVKISDFGVSGELDVENGNTAKSTFVGTLVYMSPERLQGQPYRVDSDVWALGMVLFEAALGRLPFQKEGETAANFGFWEMIEFFDTVEVTVPAGETSPELKDLIDKCLQKDPSARPTAESLLKHPWLAKYEGDEKVDLKSLVAEVKKK